MKSLSPGFSLVLTTHNQIRYTALAIASFRRFYPGAPIIVVDNNSTDETRTYVRRLEKLRNNVTFIDNEGPCNLARSWNMGVDAAKTQQVVVSNNDVAFTGRFFNTAGAHIMNPEVGLVLPIENSTLRFEPFTPAPAETAREIVEWTEEFSSRASEATGRFLGELDTWWNSQQHLVGKTERIMSRAYHDPGGFCFLIDKAKHERVGRFAEDRYPYFGEDWEYFHRVTRHYKGVIDRRWFVWHFGHRTNGKMDTVDRLDAHMRARFQLIEDCEGKRETVSIVIPVQDRVEELREAVRSVRAQTFQDWRLYVIRDGGTPGSHEAIASMLRGFDDARIGLWGYDPGRGPGAARNFGIARTKGKYVALLDSDDEWMPTHLETHVKAHERALGLSMTYSDPSFSWRWRDEALGRFVERPAKMPTIDYFGPFDRKRLERHNYILTSSTVWWGDTLRAMRFDEAMRIEEDWKLFKETPGEIVHLGQTTLRYHQQPGTNNLMEEAGVLPVKAPDQPGFPLVVAPSKSHRGATFTVVIPTKDRAARLADTLRTIGQDCPILVVDDGSADGDAVAAAVRTNPAAALVRSVGNGPSAARNAALALAQTPWVKFLDDDDALTPGWLAQHEAMVSAEVGVITCSAIGCGPRGLVQMREGEWFTSMLAFRLSALRSIGGFDESKTYAEERDLMERASTAQMVRRHVDWPCVVRSVPAAGLTNAVAPSSGNVPWNRPGARKGLGV